MAELLGFDCRRQSSSILPIFLSLTLAFQLGCGKHPAEKTPPKTSAPKIKLGAVVPLRTQWYPLRAENEDETENRLLRELVRQEALIALRDELGLVTRDETLAEPLDVPHTSDDASPEPLAIALEVNADGTWNARLYGAGASQDNPIWNHDGKFEWDRATIYSQLAQQVDEQSKTIADKLRQAGATGPSPTLNPANKPDESIEAQLEEMNFVSQFMAVRSAHEAIRKNGPSLDWFGVLTRGYAHLAALTEHTWSSHTEAFAARSLLYAERMCRLSDNAVSSRWHRAYARSIVGAHASAIDELNAIAKLQPVDQPAWSGVIAPNSHFDSSGLEKIAVDRPQLSQLVAFLSWNQYRSYMHGRWNYEHGMATAKLCPEAYGVYSVMANTNILGVKRTGSAMGASAFASLLPKRFAALAKSHPESGLDDVLSNAGSAADDSDASPISGRPMQIAKALKGIEAKESSPTECSWSILAGLVAEEQFVEAADALKVSADATEHSDADLVEILSPLVEGHRYAAYIRSYAPSRREAQRVAEIISDMTIVDPRAAMQPMFSRMWHTCVADGKNGNQLQWRAIWERGATLDDLRDTYYSLMVYWTDVVTAEQRQRIAKEFRDVSPDSPSALRLQWETSTSLTGPELAKLEQQLKNDPVGWRSLAETYQKLKYLESAERCFKRSIEISPSYSASLGLANLYFQKKRKDLWQSTLEAYLEVEDLGLDHASVHEQIGEQLIRDRNWKEAESHAIAAASTYSTSGLVMASKVYEGLQDWTKSEHFAAESSRNYPSSYAGTTWYFWCRRTGRGDLEAARTVAKASMERAEKSTYFEEAYRVFAYRLLEGDKPGALAAYEQQRSNCLGTEDPWNKCWGLFHIIALTRDLRDSEHQKKAIDELNAHVEQNIKPTYPNWADLYRSFVAAFTGTKFEEDFFAKLDIALAEAYPQHRCNYIYFVGVALDQLGEKDKAELYLRRAAFGGPYDMYNAAFAGAELAKRHGPDRGGVPEEFLASDSAPKTTDK